MPKAATTISFDFDGLDVRVLMRGAKPWFIASDVARALGYSDPDQAVRDHVDEDDRNTASIRRGIPGNPNRTIINESGLYALIFGSKLDSAKRFKRRVTKEILPSIRKTGRYMEDTRRARHMSIATYKLMATAVKFGRDEAGKEAKPYHYSNEARLVNWALTGEFGPIDRDGLTLAELDKLAELEQRNTFLLISGVRYEDRKAELQALAMPRIGRQPALPRAQVSPR